MEIMINKILVNNLLTLNVCKPNTSAKGWKLIRFSDSSYLRMGEGVHGSPCRLGSLAIVIRTDMFRLFGSSVPFPLHRA